MIPMVSPDLIWTSIFSRTGRSAVGEYLKRTWSKSIEPSFTSVIAFFLDVIELFSFNTSMIRLHDSSENVIITNTIDNIIKETMIWKPYVIKVDSCPTSKLVPFVLIIISEPNINTNNITA